MPPSIRLRADEVIEYRAGVLTEQDYQRSFGSLPPLPSAAFRNDPLTRMATERRGYWLSPLV